LDNTFISTNIVSIVTYMQDSSLDACYGPKRYN
jgi:hypothetical protein